LEEPGEPPVLPLVAFGKQQAAAHDRLERPPREHIGLIAIHAPVEDVVDARGIVQADEGYAPSCIEIGAESLDKMEEGPNEARG
jgi:hypothetical protein